MEERPRPPRDYSSNAAFHPPRGQENKHKGENNHRRKFVAKKHVRQQNELRKRTASVGSTRGSLLATNANATIPPSHVNVVNTKKIKKRLKLDNTALDSHEFIDIENTRPRNTRDRTDKSHKHKPLPRYPQPFHLNNDGDIPDPLIFSEYQSEYSKSVFATSTIETKCALLENNLNPNKEYGCIERYSSTEPNTDRYGSELNEDNTSIFHQDTNNSQEVDRYDDPGKKWWEELIAYFIYDKENPEFTTKQQYFWSFVIGTVIGIFTYVWGLIIDFCVDFVWKRIPEVLLEWGVFTDEHGPRPLSHYMWICPALFGGVLSYISAQSALPTQGTWIVSLHKIGTFEWSKAIPVFLISTAGMASGLSLGPELPLVLLGGMAGSYLGVSFNQSVLSCRVMNLTAASAAIAGFFGFPLTGALFVLELPHRMGLQYYEAFSPATLASIVAVLVKRMISAEGKIGGIFTYPPLSSDMDRNVFLIAIIYGVVGRFVGVGYTLGCLRLKKWVHDLLNINHDNNVHDNQEQAQPHNIEELEKIPLIAEKDLQPNQLLDKRTIKTGKCTLPLSLWNKMLKVTSSSEPKRAAVAGILAGLMVGIICMFLPHNLFWGEEQLQTLISRGEVPLPIFGNSTEPTEALLTHGYCLDSDFNAACAGIISVTKILVIGLSLGTGIIGGHFWGPLYVGCAASHLFVDLCDIYSEDIGFFADIVSQPGVAILCIMGSAHVVPFRAHMAIMLVLTLTIEKYTPGKYINKNADDYLAMFPILVVSCFVSLMTTKSAPLFYPDQRCRGDIKVIPEALCEPHLGSVNSSMFKSSGDSFTDDSDISTGESDESFDENAEKQLDSKRKDSEACSTRSDSIRLHESISTSSLNKSIRNRHRRTRSAPFIGRIETFTETLLEQGRLSRSRLSRSPSNSISRRSRSDSASRKSRSNSVSKVSRSNSVSKVSRSDSISIRSRSDSVSMKSSSSPLAF